MNVPSSSPRSQPKHRCFDSQNKSPMSSFRSGPPSIIVIPPSSLADVQPQEDDAVALSRSSFTSIISKDTNDDEQRWSPCKHDKRPSLPSVLPKRQDSNYSRCSSSLGSSDEESSDSILDECEKLSQELSEMMKSLGNGKRERGESSQGSTTALSQTLAFRHHRSKRQSRFRQLAEDQDSINSASVPRRPSRQTSFSCLQRDKRWCACTTDGSYASLPEAANEKVQRRASLKPQKPRRQKSDV